MNKRKYIKSGKYKKDSPNKRGRKISDLSKPQVSIKKLVLDPNVNVGTQLRNARKFMGFTGLAVSRKMNYDVGNLYHFENGFGSNGKSFGKYVSDTALRYAKAIGIKELSYIIN